LPPAIPSTLHVAVPPPGAVAANCWGCHTVRAAIRGTTLTLPLAIVTVAVLTVPAPPGPLQVNE